jgi:ribonuclease P protein component
MNYSFSKRLRLLRAADFERVMAARMSASDSMLRMYAAANGLDHPRLGMTVSRKLGNSVDRTRWKRAMREAFRISQQELPPLDLVCIPHRAAAADTSRLLESIPKLARQLANRIADRDGSRRP